jgi:ribosomal subunit interface protein
MRYQISGKHLDVGTSLQQHVKDGLEIIVDKFAERPTEAVVTFSKNAHNFVCEATVHLSTGLSVNASAQATDIYDSFEGCAARMEKQLRRYKRRLKDHHSHRSSPVEVAGASAYILASEGTDDDISEPETLTPVIVAEMETKIKSLSVGEAVMQMELAGESVLVFHNERHKGLNVVYRRKDGNIGWIDSESVRAE